MKTSHAIAALTLSLSTLAVAGPLNPPGGPVGPTYKTLAEVEARTPVNATTCPGDAADTFVISQSGSYYLTGNLQAGPSQTAIKIAASYVTLDLNGFTITGGFGTHDGIHPPTNSLNIAVRNGNIVFFGGNGIAGSTCKGAQVENVRVTLVSQTGVAVGGGSIISGCAAYSTSVGILAGNGSTVRDCTSQNASNVGILAQSGGTLRGCTANACTTGIRAYERCTLDSCNADANTANGFEGDDSLVLRDCAANNNGGIGFSIGYRDLYDGSRLTDCSANQNAGAGFYLGYSAVVSGSTAVHNGGNGFDTSADGVITNCVADINQGDGFVLNGGQIEGCRAIINGASGTNHSGIHAFYGTNRIMNNTVQAGDLGIRVENLSGNFIVGNTVSNSLTSAAAFSFPIGTNNNTMGPILSSGPIPAGTTPLANWWRF